MKLDLSSNRERKKLSPKLTHGVNSLQSPQQSNFKKIESICNEEDEEDRPHDHTFVEVHHDVKIEEVDSPLERPFHEENLYQFIQDENIDKVQQFLEKVESILQKKNDGEDVSQIEL